jgi:hypothetical protein
MVYTGPGGQCQGLQVSSIVQITSGSGWETNPPRPATRPATGVEDQEAHRDLTTPICKDNRERLDSQVVKIIKLKNFG